MYLSESLDYHAMVGQVNPTVTVDEYSAKMGKDQDVVTLSFKTNSKLAAEDLSDWFEKGYNYVLDASVSTGEIEPNKYLVFVEMNRRSTVPEHIVELITDLQTLTDIPVTDWTVQVEDEDYDADEEVLKQVIILTPLKYKKHIEREESLNEFRELSGLEVKKLYPSDDIELKNFKAIAGL